MWERRRENDDAGYETYLYEFYIEKVRFWLWMSVGVFDNAHVSLSSGLKKKHKYVFEDKGVKNPGLGFRPLLEIRKAILDFPIWYGNRKLRPLRSISVGAADSRRRRIYKRSLEPFGFRETSTNKYGKILFKKFVD